MVSDRSRINATLEKLLPKEDFIDFTALTGCNGFQPCAQCRRRIIRFHNYSIECFVFNKTEKSLQSWKRNIRFPTAGAATGCPHKMRRKTGKTQCGKARASLFRIGFLKYIVVAAARLRHPERKRNARYEPLFFGSVIA